MIQDLGPQITGKVILSKFLISSIILFSIVFPQNSYKFFDSLTGILVPISSLYSFIPSNMQNIYQPMDNTSHNNEDNNIEPESLSDFQNPTYSTQPSGMNIADENKNVGGKREFWSIEEDKMLVSAWHTISNDSIVGNGQKKNEFWARITAYYNQYRQSRPPKCQSQVKTHWH